MGTKDEAIALQYQIKGLISELGWTQNQLAREIYTELHDWDDNDEIKSFQERLKKELLRDTTKPEKLKKYLSIIISHPEAKSVDIVLNRYVSSGLLNESLIKAMGDISKEVDAQLESTYNKSKHSDL